MDHRIIHIRFYEELNDFLPLSMQKRDIEYSFKINQTVKDAVEAIGVPHTEVDLILVNGKSVGFDYQLQVGDRVSVYPVFESLDISSVIRLRPEPLRETKIILDVHLGKLCRYLRMLGFDAYYRNDLDDPEIIERSVAEKRIILTRDLGILKNGQVTHGYFLRSQDSKIQLKEVMKRFDLKNQVSPFKRCMECNGLMSRVKKTEIEHQLKEGTKKCYDNFFRCSSCRKIYWEGSHFDNMKTFIKEIKGLQKKLPEPLIPTAS
jgi:uncharacterized protein with PIN domain